MNKNEVDKQEEEGKKKNANREEQNKTIGERGVRCRGEEGGGGQIGGVASSDEMVARQAVRPGEGKRERMDGLWGKCMDGMDGVPHRESTSVLVLCTIRLSVTSVSVLRNFVSRSLFFFLLK